MMIKRFKGFLLLAILVAPLAGCGEKPEENPNVTTNDPKANLSAKPRGMGGGGTAPPAKPATE